MAAAPDGIVLPKAVGGADVVASRRQARRARGGVRPRRRRDPHPRHRDREGRAASSRSAPSPDASHRLIGLTWGGEDLSADLGAETNRGPDGAYTEPYRLARSLTLFGGRGRASRCDRFRLHQFPRHRRPRAECRRGAPRRLRRQDGDPSGPGAGDQRGLHALGRGPRARPGGRRGLRGQSGRGRRRGRRARCSTGRICAGAAAAATRRHAS